MRYLFTTVPGSSHVLPLVPLAHAALAAGHEVAVATSGAGLSSAVSAGLTAIATDDGRSARPYEEMARVMHETDRGSRQNDAELVDYFGATFAEVGSAMLPGLLDAARAWRADAVIYPPPHPAGLLAARALGIPAVLHNLGIRRPTFGPALAKLEPLAQRLGVPGPREADLQIDLSAPSLANHVQGPPQENTIPHTLRMHPSPYNGAGPLPAWALRRPGDGTRRVVVTLGSLPASYGRGELLRDIILGTRDLAVELIVATGDVELPALPQPLPGHARLVGWVPLRPLLATSDVLIHHGGLSSMYTAFVAGVPQCLIPAPGAGGEPNARIVSGRGAGLGLAMDEVTPEAVRSALRELLDRPDYGRVSADVAAEIDAMPLPAEVIGRLDRFVAEAGRTAPPAPPPAGTSRETAGGRGAR
ncbi:glycosyltransferase [Streptomyces marincola]|uniref:glycosyltransferase n=1 Tax=Streptomyces marincola TaxID=2878388 RepID=UPI001CF4C5A2|nr:glycosyltransferase [Streptomyces marincola]UCM87080.1 glycosyltransferase [Streptomyces marincola]